MNATAAPDNALKHIFDPDCYARVAALLRRHAPACDAQHFMQLALADLDALSLMQRLRRMADCLHAVLPPDYRSALAILKAMVPDITPTFATLALPDFVARYGLHDPDASMQALKFFTPFGSSEYGVRPFIRQDAAHALRIMKTWAHDPDPHVRRLASEGSRPRLPWSFHLDELAQDPSLAAPILEVLNKDDSLYVRKSVANHLNDITKRHPEWVLGRLAQWPLDDAHCAWIARHALRTLIKQGDKRALALLGVGGSAEVSIARFEVAPRALQLGQMLNLTLDITSTGRAVQQLEIDYRMHYVRPNASSRPKVFKLRACKLSPGERLVLTRRQHIRDFSTRRHHAGRHAVELMINGDTVARACFDLVI